jgi:hypothetical protein
MTKIITISSGNITQAQVFVPNDAELNYTIIAEDDNGAVQGATVDFGTETKTTDVNGQAVFTIVAGETYNYSVSKSGYNTVTGSVTPNESGAKCIDLTLTNPVHNITIAVVDGVTPIQGASVEVVGIETKITDSSGIVVFNDIPEGVVLVNITKVNYNAVNFSLQLVVNENLQFDINISDYQQGYNDGYADGFPAGVASVVSFNYTSVINFGATETYKRIDVCENRGAWTFGALTNVASYYVSVNGGAYQTSPASINVNPCDIIDIWIIKTNSANAASINVAANYGLNTPLTPTYVTTKTTVITQWALDMLASYQSIHTNQLDSATMIDEFLYRLQPNHILKNSDNSTDATGYAYNTYGPPGLNKVICDFVVMLRCDAPIKVVTHIIVNNSTKIDVDGYKSTTVGGSGIMLFDKVSEYYLSFYATNILASTFTLNGTNALHTQIPKFNDGINTYMNINVSNIYGALRFRPTLITNGSQLSNTKIGGNLDFQCSLSSTIITNSDFTTATSRKMNFSAAVIQLHFYNNRFTNAAVDTILNNARLRAAEITPTANTGFRIEGSTNGKPTGGMSNADIVAMIAIWSGAGKTITFTINT